jgi:hypothetical protein
MTSSETSGTKVSANKLSFPLDTHMTYSDARFGSYGILMSGPGAEDFLDRLDILTNDQVSGRRFMKHGKGCLQILSATN